MSSNVLLFDWFSRYFTGHTENGDGSKQFIKGQTKFDDAFNDVKIFTIAVSTP